MIQLSTVAAAVGEKKEVTLVSEEINPIALALLELCSLVNK